MKVLISGAFWHGSLEESYARAFESVGWSVVRFDWEQIARAHPLASVAFIDKLLRSKIADRVGKWLVNAVEESRPDFVFVVKGRTINPEDLLQIHKLLSGRPLINLNPDSPWEKQNSSIRLKQSIPEYDVHFTWNSHLVDQFRSAGAKAVHFLPFAHDPSLHFPVEGIATESQFDAVFVGTYSPERDKLLASLRGCTIGIWGNGWTRSSRVPREWIQSKAIYGDQATRVLGLAPCALNILRPQNEGSHNMRTFEIPATRTAMLTTRSKEQCQMLAEGSEIECFASSKELLEKIRFLKEDLDHARSVAVRGYERVREETYAKRVRTMLEILGLAR